MNETCDPKEVALKSLFLGPQAENAEWLGPMLSGLFDHWVLWRRSLFPQDGPAITSNDQNSTEFKNRRLKFENTAQDLFKRFEKEVPKFSPRYVGHMFSEISLPALVGHIVTLFHNPNNISGESSRVGIQIEEEAIQFLAEMVGYVGSTASGHFTSGGTLANFEAIVRANARSALWMAVKSAVANRSGVQKIVLTEAAHLGWHVFDDEWAAAKKAAIDSDEIARWTLGLGNPREVTERLEGLCGRKFLGPVILVPENKHYSWQKGCRMMGMGSEALWPIRLDSRGQLSIEHLRQLLDSAMLQGRPVSMVVSVVGTTELGGIDPVHQVQDLLDHWKSKSGMHFWHHVDAAYGGFFCAVDTHTSAHLSPECIRALKAMPRTQSITLDPHKLGYVPYASGTILIRDPRDYYFKTFDDAPYVDFSLHTDRGPYTIEGSRSAAGAVATWMTAKTIGLNAEGYGLLLERTLRISKKLEKFLIAKKLPIRLAPGCDTNILCFACVKEGEKTSASNQRTLAVYDSFSPKKNGAFIVSKTALRWKSYTDYLNEWTRSWSAQQDTEELILIRMTLMNPFFGSQETQINYLESFVEELSRLHAETF